MIIVLHHLSNRNCTGYGELDNAFWLDYFLQKVKSFLDGGSFFLVQSPSDSSAKAVFKGDDRLIPETPLCFANIIVSRHGRVHYSLSSEGRRFPDYSVE